MTNTNTVELKSGTLLSDSATVKARIKEWLRDLTGIVGVSGSEQEVVRYMKEKLLPYADEVKVDNNGNIIAIKNGTAPGPKLMISSHSDEVGFCVKNILPNGFIMFDKIGGVSDQLLLGRKVWVTTKKLPGLIGIKAGHMQTAEESKRVKTPRECYIDMGASSRKEVEDMGVKIGDPIVFQSDFMEMDNKDLIATKAVDNRIHCAILIELFKQLQGVDFAGTLYGVVTVQEEVGLRGAMMVGNAIQPDYAIVLDTIPAGDTPDIDTEISLPVYLGKGPACPIADGVGGTMVFNYIHPKVREMIEEQAAKASVNLQAITLIGDGYTTDAASLGSVNTGIPVGVLSTPRRYSHSPIELVHLHDALGVLKIVTGIVIDNGNKDLSFI
ncbi:M42 family peptidase [Bacillus xiapuensis]|uniref:M42 family peptidase n=1 Tax=Bacillus xiapuensis TaxID=2014075 RepID=A0ABU6NCJ5_9BACI|nr:M42 family peptidase [Bacillus xiapuensis]